MARSRVASRPSRAPPQASAHVRPGPVLGRSGTRRRDAAHRASRPAAGTRPTRSWSRLSRRTSPRPARGDICGTDLAATGGVGVGAASSRRARPGDARSMGRGRHGPRTPVGGTRHGACPGHAEAGAGRADRAGRARQPVQRTGLRLGRAPPAGPRRLDDRGVYRLRPEPHAERYRVTAPAAGGAARRRSTACRSASSRRSKTTPTGEDRIKVRLPTHQRLRRARLGPPSLLDAGDERGTLFRPEIDDEVVVGFLDGDPRLPVVLGQLPQQRQARTRCPATDDNHVKGHRHPLEDAAHLRRRQEVVATSTRPPATSSCLSEDEKSHPDRWTRTATRSRSTTAGSRSRAPRT